MSEERNSFFGLSLSNVQNVVYCEKIVYNKNDNKLVYASVVLRDNLVSTFTKEINKSNSIFFSATRQYVTTTGSKYDFIKKKDPSTDYTHVILYKKDTVNQVIKEDYNNINFTIIYKAFDSKDKEERTEFINNLFYDKLYKLSSVPILKEWIPYIKDLLISNKHVKTLTSFSVCNDNLLAGYECKVSDNQLRNIVSNLLKDGIISINGSNEKSEVIDMVDGLDSYLSFYGDILADKIQKAFVPKYNPESTNYSEYVDNYDDSCYYNGIELYKAQKSAIQASVLNMKKNDVTLVVGEMGSGKTAIGAGIAYADYEHKTGLTSIVMCPTHLVEKWKREIERLVPNAKAYIVKDIQELVALNPKIKSKVKLEHTFIIMSKEAAKTSYELRPAVTWSRSKKTFVCPCCGQPLRKRVKIGSGRKSEITFVNFDEKDMLSRKSYNKFCENKIRKINKSTGESELVTCGASLWTPVNKNEKNPKWLKLGSAGWLLKQHVETVYNELKVYTNLNKKDTELFNKVIEYRGLIANGEEFKGMKAPRKYSLAKYIRNNYKGYIDYFLADELHLYKGNSKQGQAMADIATVSNKVLGLTGTLLNGYADGLFYILFRLFPRTMLKEGYEYNSCGEFMKNFGVIKKETTFSLNRFGVEQDCIGSNDKKLPGVSPLVFTKFLLENTAFISLSDMDGGLPGYTEIPIGIEMDSELKSAYSNLEEQFAQVVGKIKDNGSKLLGSMLQTLSTYPDMPYNQSEIYNPETNEVAVTPLNLEEGIRNKERELLKITQEKIANGEKVLVYVQWTKKTDVTEKLIKMFEENNIKSAVLTSSVSADVREEWIEKKLKQNIDVLICNPKLVETGLDLLPFTTIVFYQLGYDIFTMRQASRRSWRLSQTKDVTVYFLYYENTIQEKALSLMATKLQASMAIEGKFSEEGLRAMSNNEDLLSKIANSVVEGIRETVEVVQFTNIQAKEREHEIRHRKPIKSLLITRPTVEKLSYMYSNSSNGKKLLSNKKKFKDVLNFNLNIGNLI